MTDAPTRSETTSTAPPPLAEAVIPATDGTAETGMPVGPGAALLNWLARLTVADGLLLLVVGAGAILRLVDLAALPLSPAEAADALAAWGRWQPASAGQFRPLSPAYFSLTSPLTQALGDTESIMRLVPALFGVALLFLPWVLRRQLGSVGTLVASLLLAISPLAGTISRTAGGASMALFAGTLLPVAWLRYREEGAERWFRLAALALALGLTSAPLFYGLLLVSLLSWGLIRASDLVPAMARPDRQSWQSAGLIGAGAAVLLSTMFFGYLPGLGRTTGILAAWLGQFGRPESLVDWLAPLLALGRYETGLLLLTVPAVAWATWQERRWPTLLIYWLAGALAVALIQGGVPDNALLLVIPASLLLGTLCQAFLTRPAMPYRWQMTTLMTVLLFGSFVSLARHQRHPLGHPGENQFLWLAWLLLVLALAVMFLLLSWDRQQAVQVGLVSLLTFFVFFGWGTAWWLSHEAANDPRTGWVATGTDDDLLIQLDHLAVLARQADRLDDNIPIFSTVDHPVLRWYLRDYHRVTYGPVVPATATEPVIITTDQEQLALERDYMGAGFTFLRTGVADSPAGLPPGQTARWWIFHESPQTWTSQRLILWLRRDMVRGQAAR